MDEKWVKVKDWDIGEYWKPGMQEEERVLFVRLEDGTEMEWEGDYRFARGY